MNDRPCILIIASKSKQKHKFCCYLNDDMRCTAPTYEYDYCIGFLKRLRGGF